MDEMTPPEFEPLKKACAKHEWIWDDDPKLFESIKVCNKNDMWLYNYKDGVEVARNHPVLVRCRGLVVREDGAVLNYPFDRFFNHWENEAAKIDWESAHVLEKVDGSLICVFWNPTDAVWEITTRGSFYPPSSEGYLDFAQLALPFLLKPVGGNMTRLDALQKSKCYQFELITAKNRIVKKYDFEDMFLIGIRSLEDLREESWEYITAFSCALELPTPIVFHAFDLVECTKLFADFCPDDEGLVVIDRNFHRIKIKQESYLKLARIRELNEEDLFDVVLGRVEVQDEYLEVFPEIDRRLFAIDQEWRLIKYKVRNTYARVHQPMQSRKQFALEAIKYPCRSALFRLFDGKGLADEHLTLEKARSWIKEA